MRNGFFEVSSKVFFIFVLLFPTVTFAKTSDKSNWKNSGYIDASYNYLLRSQYFTSGIYDRVFDINPNGVTLHQVSYTLAYQPEEGLGGLINPNVGRDMFNFMPYGWNSNFGMEQVGFGIPQGYLQYAHNKFTLMGGLYFTLAGNEYLDPLKNTNFSRSILWGYAEPYTHLGLRSTYVVNDKLTVFVGGNNGWDNLRDTTRDKTLKLSFVFTPNKTFALAMTGYSGAQRAADKTDFGPIGTRNFIDVVATLNLTEQLSLVGNYDYGTQSVAALPGDIFSQAIWQGFAGYINYKFNDKWRTSIRGEIFDDVDGYRTGVVQQWKEFTLTLGYTVFKNFEMRAEARHDFSNVNSFLTSNFIGTSNNQQSFALEAAAQFL